MRWRGLTAPAGTPASGGPGARRALASIPPTHPKNKGGRHGRWKTKAQVLRSGEGWRSSKAGASRSPVRSRRPYLSGEEWDAQTCRPADSRSLRQVSAGWWSLICAAGAVTLRAGCGDGRSGGVHCHRRGGGAKPAGEAGRPAAGGGAQRGPRPLSPPAGVARAPERAGSGWSPAWPGAQLRYCCRL